MKFNLFEGGRRIALLVTAVAVMIAVGNVLSSKPYVATHYRLTGPGEPFVRTTAGCPIKDAASTYFSTQTPKGRTTHVHVCLIPVNIVNANGNVEAVVPFKRDADGRVHGATNFREEISAYKKAIRADFKLPAADGAKIDRIYEEARMTAMKRQGLKLVSYLAVFWAFVFSLGWVLRGLLGIPRGQDFHPDNG
ncbi:hypothetical protein CXF96_13050 [Stenotrophomonas sp. Betaine-02u-21]|uniref:hypothetical protein n=1 Tax=unclassified Stenotrophomonas TaxID=196198 RepID=UPI000C3283F4|nr:MULTISPECIES: hypothetical protein [unclassified Stenotrophomonas]PKH73136.1 hypothetical protein CXF96_13050 [Stenotrophomonas sp. Betaine-02u-21]PKH76629.1 hypothetical protein CXF90_00575 [Stenotrophomonas sp. Betaine-02u-23]PKH96027.1 hypothetical protein CXG43_09740 [Stenotrophomonas sp. Bg11-02]